jgi:hypothetical protein
VDFFESLFGGGPHKVEAPKLRKPPHSVPEQSDVAPSLIPNLGPILIVPETSIQAPKSPSPAPPGTCQGNWECVHSQNLSLPVPPRNLSPKCICWWECFACNGSNELYNGNSLNDYVGMPTTPTPLLGSGACGARGQPSGADDRLPR